MIVKERKGKLLYNIREIKKYVDEERKKVDRKKKEERCEEKRSAWRATFY